MIRFISIGLTILTFVFATISGWIADEPALGGYVPLDYTLVPGLRTETLGQYLDWQDCRSSPSKCNIWF